MAKYLLSVRRSKLYQFIKDRFLYWKSASLYKLNSYPNQLGEDPIFVFNHIPKCGGTSLNIVLRKWFHLVRDYPPHDLQCPDPEDWNKAQGEFEENPPRLNRLKPFQILAGHYHHSRNRFSRRIGNPSQLERLKCITFLRDPLAHRLSLYKYGVKRGHDWVKGMTLNEYIHSETNFFAKVLECDEDNYKEKLNDYFFIGIMEHYQESVEKLAKKIDRLVSFKIPHVNRTGDLSEESILKENGIEKFKRDNALDYKIYQFSLDIFSEYDFES